MKRRASRIRQLVHRTVNRTSATVAAVAGLSLFAVVVCLEAVGPPPRWRIDALWVYGNERAVRVMVAAAAVAATATTAAFLLRTRRSRGRRFRLALLWIAAAGLCAAVYWDRLPIIYNVVLKHAW